MNLPSPPDRWDIDRLTEERTAALGAFGFTPRQARFLVEVLIHSGVFVERQYCRFAGITHGQKTTDFLRRLVERGYARPIATGALHRGRLFHVHHKPLYAAIGQADNRHRKPMAMGRMVERLMVLDAVLADRTFTWLGTEFDKRCYFARHLQGRVELREFPRLRFGQGAEATHRYFPDKLPIGVQRDRTNHVLLYLVTSSVPMDFRLFLLRHSELLRPLVGWTIRVLMPAPFAQAIRVFGHAARETLATPLEPGTAEGLQWFFRERQAPSGISLATSRRPFQISCSGLPRAALSSPVSDVAAGGRRCHLGRPISRLAGRPPTWRGARRIHQADPPVLPSLLPGWRRLISQKQRTTSGTTARSEVVLICNHLPSVWRRIDS